MAKVRDPKRRGNEAPANPVAILPARCKPDWELWRCRPKVELWEAVALSCDIEPNEIRPESVAGAVFLWDIFAPDLQEFTRRMTIAQSNLGEKLPVLKTGEYGEDIPDARRTVRLSDIVVCAGEWGWKLPKKFPKPAAKATPFESRADEAVGTPKAEVKGDDVTVSLPHTTKRLDAVFRIMREHWTKYDPRRLPKQTVIASEIDEALGWKAQSGSPSRGAQTLAALIRPDDLSEADNRGQKYRSDGNPRR